MDDLAARIARIDSRLALQELSARYARAIDDRDLSALADLFCEDATFEHVGAGDRLEGRDAIRRFYERVLAGYGLTVHVPHAHVIERVEGDEAQGWVVSHAEMVSPGRYLVAALRYEDDYRREDGRWRFAQRRLRFWYFTDWVDLPAVIGGPDRWTYPGPPRPADLPESLPSYREFAGAL